MLLSESASAQLQLVSTTGTQANPVFHYDITVTDTGTTNIGTFWFSWVPEENFLPTSPAAASSPAGWSATITGFGNSIDGAGIEWVATSNAITPGHSLSGFDFTTSDSPSALAANSPAHPGLPVLTAFVYSGGPFSDLGSQVSVTTVAAQVASMTTLATSAPTITAGDSLTLTATVAPAAGSGATPTGTVTFFEGSNNLGTSQVQSDGAAALVTAALPSGTLSLTAQYSGDSAYTGSTSAAITQIVTPAGTAATTVALSSSAPAPAPGTPVTVNATVSAVTSNGSTPSGNVSFFDNGAPAGEAALVDGVAQVPLTLAVGVHAITATYAGDATFAGSTSTAGVTETVTAAPTLSAAIAKDTLPSVFVPGDRGLVALQLTNAASILERGTVAIQAFVTPDGSPTDGVPITLPAFYSHMQVLLRGNGGVQTIPLLITVPSNVAAGTEQVALTVTPASGFADGTFDGGPTVSSTSHQATFGFGGIGNRHGVVFAQNNGGAITRFILAGPGRGSLISDGNGGEILQLLDTTAASTVLVIAPPSGLSLSGINADADVGAIVARGVSVTGQVLLAGGARVMLLGNVGNSTMKFGGLTPMTLLMGDVSDSSIQSANPISTMLVNSWTDTGTPESITAPSIRVLLDKGAFAGNIATTGNITTALIKGDLTGDILAGASLGPDNTPGGGDDTFAAGSITTLIVQGNVSASVIGAGLSINDDTLPLSGNASLIPGSSIRTLVITGVFADDSRALAAQLPARVRVGTTMVTPASDPRFTI